MKVEKVGTSSYRVRKTYNGTRYDVYFDHIPDDLEVMEVVSDKIRRGDFGAVKGTIEDACKKYIDIKRNVLSPSTAGGYQKIIRALSDDFKAMKISQVKQIDIQNEINRYAKGRSPKSVKNLHSFISAVMKLNVPNMTLNTTLPQKKKYNRYVPTEDEVKKILEASKGSEYHIGFQLAVFGMRRAEISAAQLSDIHGNLLSINKDRIYDEENHIMTRDNTKTEESTREVFLPDKLIKEIKKAGKIYDKTPPMLVKTLHKYQDQLGIPRFRLHDLRVFYASYAHSLGVPDVYIVKNGGWKTDYVMKSIYRNALRDKTDEMQKVVADNII